MNTKILLLVALMAGCLFSLSPALAQDSPYQRFGDLTNKDVAVNLDSGFAKMSNTSNVKFTGAEYTHTLGRVSIKMKPLLEGVDKDITSRGNVRTSGVEHQVKYSVYKDLIKEEITLKTPTTVRYSYDIWLSDWVTKTIDTSRLQKNRDWRGKNKTEIESQLSVKEVIDYARNSTIDIQPDRWGNLVVLVNNKSVVVMPRPFAIDATGKRFDLDYNLDKKNKIITITGNLSGALYPLTIDPTERVTNGDFETGDLSGWTFSASGEYAGDCYSDVWFGNNAPNGQDSYTCFFIVAGVNTTARISQTVSMIDPVTLFFQRDLYGGIGGNPNAMFSAKIANTTQYSHDCQESWWTPVEENINGFTGPQELSFELSSIVDDGIDDADGYVALDQISVGMTDFSPPAVNFIASPSSGPAPLVVQFTDISAHSPTSWLWEFADGTDTSTEQNPSHTYELAGTYDVILTATNYFGQNTEHKEYYITVTEPTAPVADFTGTPLTGTAPLTVAFTDASTRSPTSWSWDFGDGQASTQQNPSHIYADAGTYDVSLTAANAGGSDTEEKVGYVTVTETCPYSCDATLTNPPYVDYVIYSVSCPAVNSGAWHPAVCVDNTIIRWAMAGKSTPFYSDLSPNMWKRSSCCPNPGHSWAVDSPANKPIYYAAITNHDTANVKFFSHAVAAEYLGVSDVRDSRWQDWKFFNYDELNIQIGWDHQIPNGTSSFNTTVRIDNITGVNGCGQYSPSSVRAFTIDRNNSVSPTSIPMYAPGYLLSKTGKTQIKNQIIPDDIKNVMRSLNDNQQFSISKWEFDPTTEELMVYTYGIGNPQAINDLQKKPRGKYSIRVIHDAEFEKNRAEVQQQLGQLQQNPDYQIAWIAMHTDTINDPPENYVELWAYKSTPENKKLDSTVIKGWKILVLPVSELPPEARKS